MARVNIYVTDELKARMDAVGDTVNWSEVVRPAIQAAVADREHRRTRTMDSAIERLRHSKQKYHWGETEDGYKAGWMWAENEAEYDDLVRISNIKPPPVTYPGWYWETLQRTLNRYSASEICKVVFGILEPPENISDKYVAAFIEGARKFFEEVRHKI